MSNNMKRISWIVTVRSPTDGEILWRRKGRCMASICKAWHDQWCNDFLSLPKMQSYSKWLKPGLIHVQRVNLPLDELQISNIGCATDTQVSFVEPS